MNIITRAQWGARAPRKVYTVDPDDRKFHITHYSYGNRNQTVRSIQDYHMNGRGWTDIGYNFLVDYRGRLYEGRGWNRLGTHTVGFNTSGIAVCFIGFDDDVTEAAKAAIKWLAEEADRKFGKLKRTGHRDHDATTCPGDTLYRWVHSGMGTTVPPTPAPGPLDWRKEIISEMDVISFAKVTSDPDTWPRGEEVATVQAICLARSFGDPKKLVGENGEPDGIGGPGTKAAVGELQRKFKTGKPGAPSTPDYIMGPSSYKAGLLV